MRDLRHSRRPSEQGVRSSGYLVLMGLALKAIQSRPTHGRGEQQRSARAIRLLDTVCVRRKPASCTCPQQALRGSPDA